MELSKKMWRFYVIRQDRDKYKAYFIFKTISIEMLKITIGYCELKILFKCIVNALDLRKKDEILLHAASLVSFNR